MERGEPADKGVRALLAAASVVILVAGLRAASSLILPFLVAGFLAMITLPLLNWLRAKRIPIVLAVLVTMLVALLVLGGIALIIGGSIRGFTTQAPKYKESLDLMSAQVLEWLAGHRIHVPEEVSRSISTLFSPAHAVDVVTGALRGLTGVLQSAFLVVLTIVFILFEAAGFPAKLEAALGRRESSERITNIKREVQHYLAIKTVVSLATGGIAATGLVAIGVDMALLWGMLTFVLNYIPTLGWLLAAIPPVLIALVDLGPGPALAAFAIYAIAHVVLGTLLEPYLMGRRLGLSTLIVFLSMVFWGWVWGPIGMVLSVPLTMIVKIMLENTEDLAWVAVLLGSGPEREAPVRRD